MNKFKWTVIYNWETAHVSDDFAQRYVLNIRSAESANLKSHKAEIGYTGYNLICFIS